VNVDANV